jgi:hypothetical protein
MIEAEEKTEELKNYFSVFGSEIDVAGLKVKTRPMKLQLQKDTYNFISRIMAHVKETTGIGWGEAKDTGEQFLQGTAILGFLSTGSNLEECLSLFTESGTDWKKFIEDNEDCYYMILDSASELLSNFFLSTSKLLVKRISF